MPDDEIRQIDDDLVRSRRELVLIAELYLSHGHSEKAQEVMRLIAQIDKYKPRKSDDNNKNA